MKIEDLASPSPISGCGGLNTSPSPGLVGFPRTRPAPGVRSKLSVIIRVCVRKPQKHVLYQHSHIQRCRCDVIPNVMVRPFHSTLSSPLHIYYFGFSKTKFRPMKIFSFLCLQSQWRTLNCTATYRLECNESWWF